MHWSSTGLQKKMLSTLYYSGADRLLAPLTRGVGVVFMLHHVEPMGARTHSTCNVTPAFLEGAIRQVRASGYDVVSLDEAHFRLTEGEFGRPFACFTFDDGYRSVLEHAHPVFQRHDLPFAIYVATDFADGHGDPWWIGLELAIAKANVLNAKIDGEHRRLRCRTPVEKGNTFRLVYAWLRSIDESTARTFVRELCHGVGVDTDTLCTDYMMSWDEIGRLAADPRVTIGAHTRRHFALANLTIAAARAEIEESVRRIERELGVTCRHLSFPYGDETSAGAREFELASELGLRTAATSRSAVLRRSHAGALTALPRVPLGADCRTPRQLRVWLSGVPCALRLARRDLPIY